MTTKTIKQFWCDKQDADFIDAFAQYYGLSSSDAMRFMIRTFAHAFEDWGFFDGIEEALKKAASVILEAQGEKGAQTVDRPAKNRTRAKNRPKKRG